MARREAGPDPKEAALAEARCLNPHPEQVTDPEFLASDFFDARDAVQVKYEMVRKVKAGGAPVTEAAAAFGYSRPAYYAAAAALESSGLEGLVPARPGPRGAHKLTEEILAWAEEQLAADPGAAPGAAAGPDRGRPSACACTPARSSERWPAAGSATPKAADLPARETRKEDNPSLSLLPSPGHAAAEPGARPDAGQDTRPRRRAGRPLRATAPCRPARARRGVPARPRRADRQGRHRLAARPGRPGPRQPAPTSPAARHAAPARPPAPGPGGRRAHQRPGRPSRSPGPSPARPRNPLHR